MYGDYYGILYRDAWLHSTLVPRRISVSVTVREILARRSPVFQNHQAVTGDCAGLRFPESSRKETCLLIFFGR